MVFRRNSSSAYGVSVLTWNFGDLEGLEQVYTDHLVVNN
jgi:hypothetical protein